jgi:hypothetical protein
MRVYVVRLKPEKELSRERGRSGERDGGEGGPGETETGERTMSHLSSVGSGTAPSDALFRTVRLSMSPCLQSDMYAMGCEKQARSPHGRDNERGGGCDAEGQQGK